MERRKDSLVDRGLPADARRRHPRAEGPLSRLERQEIARVGPAMAKARGLAFKPAEPGYYVSER